MKNLLKLKVISISLVLFQSCLKEYKPIPEFSHPNKSITNKLPNHIKQIVIASTNNFNSEVNGSTDELTPEINIGVGGADLVLAYVKTLRDTYPKNLLLLDAGHMIGRDDKLKHHKKTLKFFKKLNYDAILLTENELIEVDNLVEYKLPFVSSNIIDITNTEKITNLSSSYIIKPINGVRVAIVGLTFFKDVLKKEEKISGIVFDDPVARVLAAKRELKKKSDIIIALAHFHNECKEDTCDDQLKKFKNLIDRFPPGLIDVVVGGDSNYTSGKYKGIPIVQNFGHGKYISRIELYFDKQKNKLIDEKTLIHSPTKTCSQFFKISNDCHVKKGDTKKLEAIKKSNNKLIGAKFLGREIYPDPQVYKDLNTN